MPHHAASDLAGAQRAEQLPKAAEDQAANPTCVDLPGEHHLAADVRDFLADLASAGKAPNTLRAYRGDLAELAQHHSAGVDQADVEALRGYVAAIGDLATSTRATELTKDSLSPRTIRKWLGQRKLQTTLVYAEHFDEQADAELRDRQRRRRRRSVSVFVS